MPLESGTRIGPYEVLAPLGAGGMGEVHRARDPRLGREVAIKGLPAAFARHPERLARFEREARLLASLQHPGIAVLYGLETLDGVPYLVLELVEGQTLFERLARGPMPLAEALDVAGQIAKAVAAAHARGIVHRDLKPGNVMLTSSGAVKVLDFGLAKGGGDDPALSPDLSISPTMGVAATGAGMILGTAAYMSPEQARGKPVDARTDVWAFGCLLYECLGGRQAFAGETVSDTIAKILEREPDWNALPASVPPSVRQVLKRCLAKKADERADDLAAIARELAALAHPSGAVGAPPSSGLSATGHARPSLAVLYFENLAKDPDSDYFCSGITEDILTDLSKIRALRVASRNAVQRYRGVTVDPSTVGAELGVDAVLEGSVRRAGDRVRITVQLVNAVDGFQLWAERYDRTMEDVFAVQEEIASSIAAALSVALAPSDVARIADARPQDVRAYDLYLKGRKLYGQYDGESIEGAMKLFREALEIDPNYALAWAGIADCYGQLCQWTANPDVPTLTRLGLEAARKAIALNPKLPEGHKAEALNLNFAGDLEGGRAALLRALDADPRFGPAYTNLVVDSMRRADVAAAERYARKAVEIDPQEAFTMSWLAVLCLETRREDEALRFFDRIRQGNDQPFYVAAVHLGRCWVHLRRHDLAAARRARADADADAPFSRGLLVVLDAAIAAAEGRLDEVRRLLPQAGELVRGLYERILYARAAVAAGDVALAASVLHHPLVRDLKVCARLDPSLHPVFAHPGSGPLRSEQALVWPLEAPMLEPAVHAMFREVRIESGRPQQSEMRSQGG